MNKVSISESLSIPKIVDQNPENIEIQKERFEYEQIHKLRMENFKMILTNYSKLPLKYIMNGFANVILSLLCVAIYTIIPAHDIIRSPKYWYETMLQTSATSVIWIPYFILNTSCWMNIKRIRKFRHFAMLLQVMILVFVLTYALAYVCWTHGLKYQWPMPHSGGLFFLIMLIAGCISIWFQFDLAWRKNKSFRQRFKFFLLAFVFSFSVGTIIYNKIIMKIFLMFPQKYQWSISIILPIIREINIWIAQKLAAKGARGDQQGMEIVVGFMICTRHAIFLAVVLGSSATTNTCIMILGVDFIINLYLTFRIIWLKKFNECNSEKQTALLQELTINEMVEFFAPLTYLLCFVLAYYSPNSHLIGNIGNAYWQYDKIKDFENAVENLFMFFAVDCISAVVCFLLLWATCRINLLRTWSCLQKEFGLIFAVNMAFSVNGVSRNILIK